MSVVKCHSTDSSLLPSSVQDRSFLTVPGNRVRRSGRQVDSFLSELVNGSPLMVGPSNRQSPYLTADVQPSAWTFCSGNNGAKIWLNAKCFKHPPEERETTLGSRSSGSSRNTKTVDTHH